MKNSAFDDFSESAQNSLDFARCQRDNGTFYGTAGQCRKGKEVSNVLMKKAQKMKKDK